QDPKTPLSVRHLSSEGLHSSADCHSPGSSGGAPRSNSSDSGVESTPAEDNHQINRSEMAAASVAGRRKARLDSDSHSLPEVDVPLSADRGFDEVEEEPKTVPVDITGLLQPTDASKTHKSVLQWTPASEEKLIAASPSPPPPQPPSPPPAVNVQWEYGSDSLVLLVNGIRCVSIPSLYEQPRKKLWSRRTEFFESPEPIFPSPSSDDETPSERIPQRKEEDVIEPVEEPEFQVAPPEVSMPSPAPPPAHVRVDDQEEEDEVLRKEREIIETIEREERERRGRPPPPPGATGTVQAVQEQFERLAAVESAAVASAPRSSSVTPTPSAPASLHQHPRSQSYDSTHSLPLPVTAPSDTPACDNKRHGPRRPHHKRKAPPSSTRSSLLLTDDVIERDAQLFDELLWTAKLPWKKDIPEDLFRGDGKWEFDFEGNFLAPPLHKEEDSGVEDEAHSPRETPVMADSPGESLVKSREAHNPRKTFIEGPEAHSSREAFVKGREAHNPRETFVKGKEAHSPRETSVKSPEAHSPRETSVKGSEAQEPCEEVEDRFIRMDRGEASRRQFSPRAREVSVERCVVPSPVKDVSVEHVPSSSDASDDVRSSSSDASEDEGQREEIAKTSPTPAPRKKSLTHSPVQQQHHEAIGVALPGLARSPVLQPIAKPSALPGYPYDPHCYSSLTTIDMLKPSHNQFCRIPDEADDDTLSQVSSIPSSSMASLAQYFPPKEDAPIMPSYQDDRYTTTPPPVPLPGLADTPKKEDVPIMPSYQDDRYTSPPVALVERKKPHARMRTGVAPPPADLLTSDPALGIPSSSQLQTPRPFQPQGTSPTQYKQGMYVNPNYSFETSSQQSLNGYAPSAPFHLDPLLPRPFRPTHQYSASFDHMEGSSPLYANAPPPPKDSYRPGRREEPVRRKPEGAPRDPNKHWLIQEAEQRRIEEGSSSLNSTFSGSSEPPHYGVLPQPDPMPSYRHVAAPSPAQRHSKGVAETKRSPIYENLPLPKDKSSPPVLSVSGRKKCSHCGQELGRGAAMIIESLRLFYHLGCFRCCVCEAPLGNGEAGADVRVRNNRLHCQNCYSNDQARSEEEGDGSRTQAWQECSWRRLRTVPSVCVYCEIFRLKYSSEELSSSTICWRMNPCLYQCRWLPSTA
ncbi:unnamed protein product, partial [Cyprideis torosa]